MWYGEELGFQNQIFIKNYIYINDSVGNFLAGSSSETELYPLKPEEKGRSREKGANLYNEIIKKILALKAERLSLIERGDLFYY